MKETKKSKTVKRYNFMYCAICNKTHNVRLKTFKSSVKIKGVKVHYSEDMYVCYAFRKSGDKFVSCEMVDNNLKCMRKKYKKMINPNK